MDEQQNQIEEKPQDTIQGLVEQETPTNMFDFRRMEWYEWFAAAPAILLLVNGGAVGALIGMGGWWLILKILRRKKRSTLVNILIIFGLTALYFVVYLILAVIITGFVYGLYL